VFGEFGHAESLLTLQNRVPDDLYHHGVQKERMVGFLDALKARCEVVELDGGKDWRKGVWADVNKWYRDQREFDAEWTSAGGEKAGELEVLDKQLSARTCRPRDLWQTIESTCSGWHDV
jgi:predicted ATPase